MASTANGRPQQEVVLTKNKEKTVGSEDESTPQMFLTTTSNPWQTLYDFEMARRQRRAVSQLQERLKGMALYDVKREDAVFHGRIERKTEDRTSKKKNGFSSKAASVELL